MLKRTLIRNASVITVDPKLGNLDKGDVLVEGSKIAAVGVGLKADDAEIIDGTGTIVMPGMVDTHRHVWQTTLRNIAADWTLDQYFAGVRGQLGEHFRGEDIYTANLAGACEALNAGITTVLDWSHNMNTPAHTDGAVQGLRDSGGRFVMCYGNSNAEWLPVSNLPTSRDAYRVKKEHFSRADDLVQMGMALRGPQYATEKVTIDDWALARDIGALISVHVGDGAWGKNRPVAWLAEQGLLGEDVVCVHCNSLADDEFRIMADHGAWASMTPDIELQMGHGWPATRRLLDVGLAPTLGVDIVTSNSGHLFQVMRTVLLVERAWAHHHADQAGEVVQRLPIDTSDVLAFATLNGARALGMADRIGSLTPGKDADIAMIRADNLEMAPLNNPVGAVVLAGHPGLVDSVWVAGKAVKRHGKLVNVDVPRLIGELERSRDHVLALAGVAPGERFLPAPYSH
ncbi:5-methylthioadenosine/S-adenosylhomocysteine deaminase MtaD (plasmid) [Cupriavidus necator N-1]|uniref:5-methylthioadenosine/S-adenosylhomocysteine deaminase MtaD n=1 Tax=Cupriavidus necator (strain ATCC 43291 / DSM 13513 / CCUG 52238 / LMG 8453 / N-1) TaxID=1042878 RepID=F8GY89_CUPNN|nr:amidohydrolase family protein [Cupriavidus necator]AEI82830.1 5-methylthioadenosine/S-adenosylhomocysteine deaminase MtaD [Cupriavidus necator N-1]MDX6008626.1 amidohydrolase family protein [Cupriavidus necator]